jgi:hypothetical protein
LQAGELANLRRQRGQLVVTQIKPLKVSKLPEFRRQGGELVATQIKRLQAGELADSDGRVVGLTDRSSSVFHRARRFDAFQCDFWRSGLRLR